MFGVINQKRLLSCEKNIFKKLQKVKQLKTLRSKYKMFN